MGEDARRVRAMQTIEAVKGQMNRLRHELDDIETVLLARQPDDAALIPVVVEQIGVLICALQLLREQLTGDAVPHHGGAQEAE